MAVASRTAAASTLGAVRSSLRTSSGPTNCPAAKAVVMAAMRRFAAGASSRAACIAAKVTTMKVPPTVTAATATAGRPGLTAGARTPTAITVCASAHTRSGP